MLGVLVPRLEVQLQTSKEELGGGFEFFLEFSF